MTLMWKSDFVKEIKVSPNKLDSLMEELDLDYTSTPRDKKMKVVSPEAQKKVKDYLWIK